MLKITKLFSGRRGIFSLSDFYLFILVLFPVYNFKKKIYQKLLFGTKGGIWPESVMTLNWGHLIKAKEHHLQHGIFNFSGPNLFRYQEIFGKKVSYDLRVCHDPKVVQIFQGLGVWTQTPCFTYYDKHVRYIYICKIEFFNN